MFSLRIFIMNTSPEEVQRAFEIIQAIRDQADKQRSKPQNMSNEGMTFAGPVGRLAEIENVSPSFNKTVNDLLTPVDRGKGSKMVENEKPSLENKPSPSNRERKIIERATHYELMAKDDMEAKKAEILRIADQIRDEQGPQLGLGR